MAGDLEGKKMKNKKAEISQHRVITFLNRQQMDFLDTLGKDALFSTGHKLSYNEILKGLIEFAKAMGLSGEKVRSWEDLKNKLAYITQPRVTVERRRYPRIQKTLGVSFRILETLGECEISNTQNLSIDGLCVDMYSSGSQPAMDQLLEVLIDDKQEEPIRAIGKVVWVKEKEDNHGFTVGLKLTYVRDEDRQRFLSCLEGGMRVEQAAPRPDNE